MSGVGAIVNPDEYPHGLRCMSCNDVIKYGDTHVYKSIDIDVNEVWCANCALIDALLKEGFEA